MNEQLYKVSIDMFVMATDPREARQKVADNVGVNIRPSSGIFSNDDSPEAWLTEPWDMDG